MKASRSVNFVSEKMIKCTPSQKNENQRNNEILLNVYQKSKTVLKL